MDYGGVLTDGAPMLALPGRARAAGLPTALVSDGNEVPDSVRRLFDVVVLGAQIGARKPDPEVFRRVAAMLDVPPQECLMVDDLARNIRGARAAGMVTVRHHDLDVTVAEVGILLDLPPA